MILIGRGLDLRSQRVDCLEAQVSSCAVLKVRKRRKEHTISGANSLRDPPVPIPNTEVKPQHADGTWLATARESRSSPDSIFLGSPWGCPFFGRIFCDLPFFGQATCKGSFSCLPFFQSAFLGQASWECPFCVLPFLRSDFLQSVLFSGRPILRACFFGILPLCSQ